jgi:DNA-binding PucR family transcriptional regulator
MILLLFDFEGRRPGHVSQLLRIATRGKKVIAAEHSGELVVIAPADGAMTMAEILQKAIRSKMGFASNVILSKEVRTVSELPSAYEAARQCLALMRRLGKKGDVDTVSNLAVYSILFSDKGGAEIDAFVKGTIGAILKHDETRSVALSGTLLAYLENGYDTRETAEKLNIHPNTLRQRLDTLDAVLGNWREHSRAFEIHVALRLHRLRSESAQPKS